MKHTEEEQYEIPDEKPTSIPIRELVTALFESRRFLLTMMGIGLMIAATCAFLLPNEYTSTAQLMPPDQQAFSSSSMLTGLSGSGSGLLSSGVSASLMSQKTPGQLAIGILSSRTSLNDIIKRFDLRQVYHYQSYVDTQKHLLKRSSFLEDKKDGIITITVTDRDRYRARDIAAAYIEELNTLANRLSTSSARRERIFLEQRLKSIKSDLDASSLALSQFSSHNATLDLEKQGEAAVEATNKLQAQLIYAQSEYAALKAAYTDDNVRVREARGRIDELQSQLRKMSGTDHVGNGVNLKVDQMLPSVRELPLLGVRYYDLYRQVTMEEALYENLSKQYELAKVQEAKEIPSIMELDAPNVPEKRSSPHRILIIFFGIFLGACCGVMWIFVDKLWERPDSFNTTKEFATTLFGLMRGNRVAR